MTNSPQILLTLDQIQGWEKEAEDLAREIARDQARLDELRQKLKAAEFFRPAPARTGLFAKMVAANDAGEAPDSDNMVAAIERLASGAQAPIPKKVLKHLLAQEGFASDRLANYFYTAIHRLKAKDRISVMANGDVWKARDRSEAEKQ
jgi:hypothetical protein